MQIFQFILLSFIIAAPSTYIVEHIKTGAFSSVSKEDHDIIWRYTWSISAVCGFILFLTFIVR